MDYVSLMWPRIAKCMGALRPPTRTPNLIDIDIDVNGNECHCYILIKLRDKNILYLTILSIQRLFGRDRSIAIRPPIVHLLLCYL
jgi:hypothetical protein